MKGRILVVDDDVALAEMIGIVLKSEGFEPLFCAHGDEALEAFQLCTRLEGIVPALESAHGLAQVMKLAPTMGKEESIVLCLSGRGDKDVESVGRRLGMAL